MYLPLVPSVISPSKSISKLTCPAISNKLNKLFVTCVKAFLRNDLLYIGASNRNIKHIHIHLPEHLSTDFLPAASVDDVSGEVI